MLCLKAPEIALSHDVIERCVKLLKTGSLAIYPTDTTYALGCDLFSRRSIERIYQLKQLARDRPLSFLCADFTQINHYAVLSPKNYQCLKRYLPGPYTFILPASPEVPKMVQTQQATVGVRIADHPIPQALLQILGHPMLTTTAVSSVSSSATKEELVHVNDLLQRYTHSVDVLLDGGSLPAVFSSVVDLTGEKPRVLRKGLGDVSDF